MQSIPSFPVTPNIDKKVVGDILEWNPRTFWRLHHVARRLEAEYEAERRRLDTFDNPSMTGQRMAFANLCGSIRPIRLGAYALAVEGKPWPRETSQDLKMGMATAAKSGFLIDGLVLAAGILLNPRKNNHSPHTYLFEFETTGMIFDQTPKWLQHLSQNGYIPHVDTVVTIMRKELGHLPVYMEDSMRFLMNPDRDAMRPAPSKRNWPAYIAQIMPR